MIFWIVNPFDTLPHEPGRALRYGMLCRTLADAGHQVVWWSADFHHGRKQVREPVPPDPPATPGSAGLAGRRERGELQVRLVPTPPYSHNLSLTRWRSHTAYARNWERAGRGAVERGELPRPDRIVVSQPPLGAAQAAFRLRASWGCRVIVDIMDAWPETFFRMIPAPAAVRAWLGPLLFHHAMRLAKQAYREADGVSAVGQTYLDLAATHGSTRPQQLCYHGIDLQPASPRAERYSSDPLRLVYIGSMGASYDLETVLSGVAGLIEEGRSVSLDLAGSGPKEEMVQAFIRRQPDTIRQQCRFRGYLGADELRRLLGESYLGLIPMKPESWVAVPYKAADYAEAGLAMINGLTGETAALLARYDAGLSYQVGNPESFKNAVNSYLVDPKRLRRDGVNARRLAEECFDRRRIYPAFMCFLEQEAPAP